MVFEVLCECGKVAVDPCGDCGDVRVRRVDGDVVCVLCERGMFWGCWYVVHVVVEKNGRDN